jgi:RNA-binding protein 5/10
MQGYENGGWDAQYGYQQQSDAQWAYEERPQRGGVPFKKKHIPSEPSPHVIFLGLDPDFTEADVCRPFMCSFDRQ